LRAHIDGGPAIYSLSCIENHIFDAQTENTHSKHKLCKNEGEDEMAINIAIWTKANIRSRYSAWLARVSRHSASKSCASFARCRLRNFSCKM
jgi:hypothetical protein